MREDGKFYINGEIPEGQASVTALLSDCFELAYDLRNDASEERGEEGTSHDAPDDDEDHEEKHGGPSSVLWRRVIAQTANDQGVGSRSVGVTN